MNLSFLDALKYESSTISVITIVSCIALLVISYIIYSIFEKGTVFIAIFSIVLLSSVAYFMYSDFTGNKESKDKQSQELINAINKTYGLKIAKEDSESIIREYENGSSSNNNRKISVKKESSGDIIVVYYNVDGSELNLYRGADNDTFKKIKPK